MELNPTDQQRLYEKAKKKVQNIRSFYVNIGLYCLIIPILIFINLTYTPEFHWFYFSMTGWGIGLLFHAMEAFDWNPVFGKDWEERKLKEILDKENRKTES